MKVGTDGVLLGAWCGLGQVRRLCDIGTGTGLIAIMAAQRYPGISIVGLELDPAAAEEASLNVGNCPWANRIGIVCQDFLAFYPANPFQHFVCNPPYFSQGPVSPSLPRYMARSAGSLPLAKLLAHTLLLGSPGHGVSLVLPMDYYTKQLATMLHHGYGLKRLCRVRSMPSKPYTRVLIELAHGHIGATEQTALTIAEAPGMYSGEFQSLCRDFYLSEPLA